MPNQININRKNYLLKVLAVQEIYLAEKKHEGITNVWIYEKKIYPVFFISKPTFYKYLGVNAKKELADIEGYRAPASAAPALLLLLCAFLFSCTSQRSLQDAAIRQYPVRDSVVVHHDTIPYEIDLAPYEVTVLDTVPCPPGLVETQLVYRTKTVTIPGQTVTIEVPRTDTTVWQRYTAVEAQLQDALRKCQAEKEKADAWKDKAHARQKWFYWFLLCALLLVGQNIFRIIRQAKK